MKKIALFILLLFFVLYPSTKRFDPLNLYSLSDPPLSKLEEPIIFKSISGKRFRYLGQGSQCYVFICNKEEVVLKLFKARHKKHPTPARIMRELRKTKTEKKMSEEKWELKFRDSCRRYQLAWHHLRRESGLIALHFESTSAPLFIELVDSYAHEIDLSCLPFILQRKAILTADYLDSHKENQNELIEKIKKFFTYRCEKGFSDPHQSLSINYGFIDGEFVQIDVGKIEPFVGNTSLEIERIHSNIDRWIEKLPAS